MRSTTMGRSPPELLCVRSGLGEFAGEGDTSCTGLGDGTLAEEKCSCRLRGLMVPACLNFNQMALRCVGEMLGLHTKAL